MRFSSRHSQRRLWHRTTALLATSACVGIAAAIAPPTAEPAQASTPAAAAAASSSPSPESLLARHLEASGGAATLAASVPMTINARVRFEGAPVTGTYVARHGAASRFKVVIDLAELGTVSQGFDGSIAWSLDAEAGPRVLAGPERAQMEREAAPDREARLFEGFPIRETRSRAKRGGVDCWEVHAKASDGTSLSAFFEDATGLLRGVDRVTLVAGTPVKSTSTIRAYEWFTGPAGRVQLPSKIEIAADDRSMTLEVSGVSFDPLDQAAFAPPEAIRLIEKESATTKPPAPEAPGSPAPATPSSQAPATKNAEPSKKPD